MKKILSILTIIAFSTLSVVAQEKEKAKQVIDVKGNCEMCKKRIEKAALDVSGVRSVEWTSDKQAMTVYINPKKTTGLDVQTAVAKAGHDTQDVKATNEAYENLHSCCKYER